jgi:hypothetical protein
MRKGDLTTYEGLNFKLDVGLYRLDQQVACQRYRQTSITANVTERGSLIKELAAKLAPKSFAPVYA